MKSMSIPLGLFTKVDQLGFVVQDMGKAMAHFQSLGIGPFDPPRNFAYAERELYGKPVEPESVKIKIMVAPMGQVQLELIQPLVGQSPWMTFLQTKGEGINHLGFFVPDVNGEEARLVGLGYEIVYRSRYTRGGGAVYFDVGNPGGLLFEIVQWPPAE